jgi:hypothetical protein
LCHKNTPNQLIERILVVLDWLIVGSVALPLTPNIVLPLTIELATQSVTAEAAIETVPPEVYPAGIVTVPDFVLIVPLVLPLFAMLPLIEPDELKALLPVRMSAAEASAEAVSKNFAVPPPLLGMSTSGTAWYVTPLIITF